MRPSLFVFFVHFVLTSSFGLAPLALAAGHTETRLESRLLLLSQTKSNEKYETEEEDASGTTVKGTETTKTDEYSNSTAYPLLGVTAFNDGLVLGFSLLTGTDSFSFGTIVGSEMSKTFEAGLFADMTYSNTKENKKSEPDGGGSTEEKSHDATRDLAVGPYLRLTIPSGSSKVEVMPILQYLRHESDSTSSFSNGSEEKAGFGLTIEPALVININKNLQYFGALDLSYKTYSSGKKVDGSGSTKKTSKLKTDTETSLSVTPLGLRLIL